MYFLLKMGIFHCYVSLPEGKSKQLDVRIAIAFPSLQCLRVQIFKIAGFRFLEFISGNRAEYESVGFMLTL